MGRIRQTRIPRVLPTRGVQVIETSGLPEGYEPPSASMAPPAFKGGFRVLPPVDTSKSCKNCGKCPTCGNSKV